MKGLLTPGGNLLLKGAKFKLGDLAAIGSWMDKLKQGGEEGLTAKPVRSACFPSNWRLSMRHWLGRSFFRPPAAHPKT